MVFVPGLCVGALFRVSKWQISFQIGGPIYYIFIQYQFTGFDKNFTLQVKIQVHINYAPGGSVSTDAPQNARYLIYCYFSDPKG